MQEIKIAMNYTNLTQDFIQLKTHNLKTTFHDHNTLLDYNMYFKNNTTLNYIKTTKTF